MPSCSSALTFVHRHNMHILCSVFSVWECVMSVGTGNRNVVAKAKNVDTTQSH